MREKFRDVWIEYIPPQETPYGGYGMWSLTDTEKGDFNRSTFNEDYYTLEEAYKLFKESVTSIEDQSLHNALLTCTYEAGDIITTSIGKKYKITTKVQLEDGKYQVKVEPINIKNE
jgi:hypothetical protein